MTKAQFTAEYKNLFTIYFNFEKFGNNQSVAIKESDKQLTEFLEFYTPRYAKNGYWDNRSIEQIVQDGDSTIVQLKDVMPSPAEWGLQPFDEATALSKSLWPIPIATDALSGKTLILDSNHTVCTLLQAGINIQVRCIELTSDNLSDLGVDLRLMQS